jgi:predicted Zn-dependent protease
LAALIRATGLDKHNATSWGLLAIAEGRSGNIGKANLAQAERALLSNKPEEALGFAKRALNEVSPHSPAALRASDIDQEAKQMIREKKG